MPKKDFKNSCKCKIHSPIFVAYSKTKKAPVDSQNYDRPYRRQGNNQGRTFEKPQILYSQKMRGVQYRTIFFDVKPHRTGGQVVCVTESQKNRDGSFKKHSIYIYREDMDAFVENLQQVIDHVRNNMPLAPAEEEQPGYERYEVRNDAPSDSAPADTSVDTPVDAAPPAEEPKNEIPQAPPATDESAERW